MSQINFRYTYRYFPCIFKKHLPRFLFESEQAVREDATDYKEKSIELVAFQKVGWFKYLTVWKVTGYLKEGE